MPRTRANARRNPEATAHSSSSSASSEHVPPARAPTLTQRVVALEHLLEGISQQLLSITQSRIPDQAVCSQERPHLNSQRERNEPRQDLVAYEGSLMPYDGKLSWEEYMVHLEVTAVANEWTTPRKGRKLASMLRGPALTVLTDLPPSVRTSYPDLVQALSSRFGQRNQSSKLQLILQDKRQG
uniref:Uncharacterized protein n=2 Tax=Lygus hesperus TaxID=30085 RepID=A0A0K8SFD2_LYGHE